MVRIAGLRRQVAAGVVTADLRWTDAAGAARCDRRRGGAADEAAACLPWPPAVGTEPARRAIARRQRSDADANGVRSTNTSKSQVFPVLTPLAVDPGHPFPYISNLSLSIAAEVRDPEGGVVRFARVKVPRSLPRWVPVEGRPFHFVPLEQVIGANLGSLFPGLEVAAWYAFRITRYSDLDIPVEEPEDLLASIEEQVFKRRFGEVVRVEVQDDMPSHLRALLLDELREDDVPESSRLAERDIQDAGQLLDLSDLMSLAFARPAAHQGSAVQPHGAGRAARREEHVRPHSRERRDGAPSVRFVHGVGRAVPRRGGARPAGAGDQAHALSHVGRHGARRRARRSGAVGQAGGGDRGAQGALRRSEQHRLGAAARRRRRARRVRLGDAQDAREDRARRAPRGRRHAALHPFRQRQLQLEDGAALHRRRPVHVPSLGRRGRQRSIQFADGLLAPADLSQAARRAVESSRALHRVDRARSGACGRGSSGADHRQDERARRRGGDRRAVSRVAGGRDDRPDRARDLLSAPGTAGRQRAHSRGHASSADSSSIRGSGNSRTAATRSSTSARATGCRATSIGASRRRRRSRARRCTSDFARCSRRISTTTVRRGSCGRRGSGRSACPRVGRARRTICCSATRGAWFARRRSRWRRGDASPRSQRRRSDLLRAGD